MTSALGRARSSLQASTEVTTVRADAAATTTRTTQPHTRSTSANLLGAKRPSGPASQASRSKLPSPTALAPQGPLSADQRSRPVSPLPPTTGAPPDRPWSAPARRHQITELCAMRIQLTGQLELLIAPLGDGVQASHRQLLGSEWYVLLGPTRSKAVWGKPQADTGFGAYIGTSGGLCRAWASLQRWTTGCQWRLLPQTLVLVRTKDGSTIDTHTRLLVEALRTRTISAAGYTLLNWQSSAPAAWDWCTRQERRWASDTAAELADLVLRLVLRDHPPAGLGGCAREQLVRLVLSGHQALDTDEILALAAQRGIPVPGEHPRQRTRRDLSTREADSGKPRVYRTHIGGRAVFYPPSMSLREARADYTSRHPGAATAHRKRPAHRGRRRVR